MHKILLTVVLSLMPAVASAACFGPGQPLFQCSFKGGKTEVNLCIQNDIVTYMYGPKGRSPDLLLTQQSRDVYMRPWPGIGRYYWEEISLNNGAHRYGIDYSFDKMSDDEPVAATLTVSRGDKVLATLSCDPGSVQDASFLALEQQKTKSGQCWNREAEYWEFC